jgi:lysylphosphatidylglycerol synthetase-like protein (DUF2156 family)
VTVVRALLRRVPVTLGFVVILIVAAATTGIVNGPNSATLAVVSTGFRQLILAGRWWTPVTSVFFVQSLGQLLFVLLAAAVCIGLAELRIGSLRTLAIGLVSSTAGIILGIVMQELGVLRGEMWSRDVIEFRVVDPTLVIVGVVLAASAFTGTIWRSRIRVATLSVCVVFLLYSGQPADLYRVFAALVGLVLGIAMQPNLLRSRWSRSEHHEPRILLASVVAITAVGPVITLFSGRRYGLLAPLGLLMSATGTGSSPGPGECTALRVTHDCLRDLALERIGNSNGPVILTILPLVTLLVAASGLSRGRRLAAWLSIGVNIALAGLAAFYYGFLPLSGYPELPAGRSNYWEITLSLAVSVIVPLVIAGLLIKNLKHFTIRSERGRVAWYLTAIGVSAVGLSVIYVGVGWLIRSQFTPTVGLTDLLSDLPERFIPVGFLRHELVQFLPHSPLAALIYNWIGPIFWAVIIVGALYAYLDRGTRNYTDGVHQVRALLRAGGGGFLSQWATWKGNSYWFSADGRAGVAYRVIAGVAITTSEPIGDGAAALDAIEGFSKFCDDHGWLPVFYAIHSEFLPAVRSMGWRSTVIGEEAVIRPAQWSTKGKNWQDVRSSISRAERLGVGVEWTTFGDLSPEWVRQIREISEQWVSEKGLPEMGFTLGSIEELNSPDVGLMIAFDSAFDILAVTSWLPSFRDGRVIGWTLDFMRRAPGSMNGVVEFVIARAAERFRDEGAEFMSLSTAPLATSAPPVTVISHVLAWVSTKLEPLYGFHSLFQFKKKFQPELNPIYIAYPDALGMPAIAIALARAYLPSLSLRQGIRFVGKLSKGRRRPARAQLRPADDLEHVID